jgi:hypothetical protein
MERETLLEEKQIERAVVRLSAKLLGIVTGMLLGIGLFLATIFLVLKGGPDPGAHLGLLSQFFPGYRVTFLGSFVGFGYAFLTGFLIGMVLGAVYNKVARV